MRPTITTKNGNTDPPRPEAGAASILHADQLRAVALATDPTKRVSVIYGSPGTGKTTVLRAIVAHHEARGAIVSLAAPTGKAAIRMRQQTGRPASTIHRLLEPAPPDMAFTRTRSNPLAADVLALDESSMIDIRLARAVLSALRPAARLIIVGDAYQLPAVGPGNVLGDMISSGVVPAVELTAIKRQNPGALLRAIHEIKAGRVPAIANNATDDLFFDDRREPAEIAAAVVDLVVRRLPAALPRIAPARFGGPNGECGVGDVLRDIQVLSPMRSQGPLSCDALNRALQAALIPAGSGSGAQDAAGGPFRVAKHRAHIQCCPRRPHESVIANI